MRLSKTLILGCVFWLTTLAVAHAQTGRPEVVLIRGGAGYWPGARLMAAEFSNHGFEPKIIVGPVYALEAARIARQYHSGQRFGPVTIVGYSSGADYACRMCRSLESRGVPVHSLVLIESTFGVPVPANVEFCLNLFKSRPSTDWIPAFRGIPVEAEGSNTVLMNIDVNESSDLQWLAKYNHFTMASNMEARVLVRNLLLTRNAMFVQQQQTQLAPSAPTDNPPTNGTMPPAPSPVPDPSLPAPLPSRTLPPIPTLSPVPAPQAEANPPELKPVPPSPISQLPELHQVAIPVVFKR